MPEGINLVIVDVETGLKPTSNTKKVIYESFKTEDDIIDSLENLSNKDRLGSSYKENKKIILKFY